MGRQVVKLTMRMGFALSLFLFALAPAVNAEARGALGSTEADITSIVEKASSSVVTVTCYWEPAGEVSGEGAVGEVGEGRPLRVPQSITAFASGFVIDDSGSILTTSSVLLPPDVAGMRLQARLPDGQNWPVTVVGVDPRLEIALLKISGEAISSRTPPPLPLGDSGAVKRGSFAIVIGNLAGLEGSVSLGVIAGINRDAPWDSSLGGLLQVTTPVAGGCGGAPVIDSEGYVVGMLTATWASGGALMSSASFKEEQMMDLEGRHTALPAQGASADSKPPYEYQQTSSYPPTGTPYITTVMPAGIQPGAFAIPINAVTKILAELRAGGSVRRASLGTRVRDALATSAVLPQGGGALVLSVEQGGAAEAAGIKAGDVITRFGGKWVKDAVHLSQLVADSRPGDQIQVEIIRQEVLSEVSVTLGAAEAPQTPHGPSSPGPYGAMEEGGCEF